MLGGGADIDPLERGRQAVRLGQWVPTPTSMPEDHTVHPLSFPLSTHAAGISLFALRSSTKVTSKLAHPNAPLGYFLCFVNLTLDGYTNAAQVGSPGISLPTIATPPPSLGVVVSLLSGPKTDSMPPGGSSCLAATILTDTLAQFPAG